MSPSDFPFLAGDLDCLAAEVDFITLLRGGGAEVGGLRGFAGLGVGLLVERSEDGVVGDGGWEVLEMEFGDAPSEEFFGPEGDGLGFLAWAWQLGVSLARRGQKEFHFPDGGQQRFVCV